MAGKEVCEIEHCDCVPNMQIRRFERKIDREIRELKAFTSPWLKVMLRVVADKKAKHDEYLVHRDNVFTRAKEETLQNSAGLDPEQARKALVASIFKQDPNATLMQVSELPLMVEVPSTPRSRNSGVSVRHRMEAAYFNLHRCDTRKPVDTLRRQIESAYISSLPTIAEEKESDYFKTYENKGDLLDAIRGFANLKVNSPSDE